MIRCLPILLCCIVLQFSITHGQIHSMPQDSDTNRHSSASHALTTHDKSIEVGSFKVTTNILKKGILFEIYDQQGQPASTKETSGRLELKVGDNTKVFKFELKPLKENSVGAAIDLTKVEGERLQMTVELLGLTSEPLTFVTEGKFTDTLSDKLLISLQKVCPVSQQPLGSMGKPPKVQHGGKSLFVCCAACTDKLKSDAQKYFAAFYSARGKQVAPGVVEATLADSAAILAQKKCPVMDKELGGMGTPQKVNVQGKAVFICCGGCADKLLAEPEKYLAVLAQDDVSPPDFR